MSAEALTTERVIPSGANISPAEVSTQRLHRKLNTEQHEPNKKKRMGESKCSQRVIFVTNRWSVMREEMVGLDHDIGYASHSLKTIFTTPFQN